MIARGARVGLPGAHLAPQDRGPRELGPRRRRDAALIEQARARGPAPHRRPVPLRRGQHAAGRDPAALGARRRRRGHAGPARRPRRARAACARRWPTRAPPTGTTSGSGAGPEGIVIADIPSGRHPEWLGKSLAEVAAARGQGSVRGRLRPAAGGAHGRGHGLVLAGRGGGRALPRPALRERLHGRPARRPAAPARLRDLPAHPRPLRARAEAAHPRGSGAQDDLAGGRRLRLRRPGPASRRACAPTWWSSTPRRVADRATFEDPMQFPVGIRDVLVGGEFVVRREADRQRGRARSYSRALAPCPCSPTPWAGSRSGPEGWDMDTEDCVTTLRSPRGRASSTSPGPATPAGGRPASAAPTSWPASCGSSGSRWTRRDRAAAGPGLPHLLVPARDGGRALAVLVGHRRRDRAAHLLHLRPRRAGRGGGRGGRRSCARCASTTPRRCTDGRVADSTAAVPDLLRRMFREHEREGKVFDLPARKFWHGAPDLDTSVRLPRPRAPPTPSGPAAGPQDQMAQNIVLAWLAGSRILELKTVQINDRLVIPRPCIDATNVGYNVEWSQELRLRGEPARVRGGLDAGRHAARGEPARPAVGPRQAGHHPRHERRLRPGRHPLARRCAAWIEAMKDARAGGGGAARARSPTTCAASATSTSRTRLSDQITLSTFHGCPAGEIEGIVRFLLTEMDVHVTVKLNPTLLGRRGGGRAAARRPRLPRGRDARRGLRQGPAVGAGAGDHRPALRAGARRWGARFQVKFSNTLVVRNHRPFFPASEAVMYLSGEPLHVITLNLVEKYRQRAARGADLVLGGRGQPELPRLRRPRLHADHHLHRPAAAGRLRPAARATSTGSRSACARWACRRSATTW